MEASAMAYVGAGIGAGLAIIGGGAGIGRLAASAMEGIARQPQAAGNIQTAMLIAAALIEGATDVHAVEVNGHINHMMLYGDPSGYLPYEPPPVDSVVPDSSSDTTGTDTSDTMPPDTASADSAHRVITLAEFRNGALGTFEATRYAAGRKNYNSFEVNGSKGSIIFNLERMNELEYYDCADPSDRVGFRLIQATADDHPFMATEAGPRFWPVAHIIGYEHTFIFQDGPSWACSSSSAAIPPSLTFASTAAPGIL